MKIDLSQTITTSELQPKIFTLTKSLAKDTQGHFLAVVDRKKNIISYLVSPILFEKLYNKKSHHEKLIKKMEEDYSSLSNDDNEDTLEVESLIDFHADENDISPEEEDYYNKL